MNNQLAMWGVYISQVANSPFFIAVFVVSFVLSLFFYLLFRRTMKIKIKVIYLYSHIFLLFVPFITSAILWKCYMPVYSCSPKLIIMFTSVTGAVGLLLSFLILPFLYNWANRCQEIKDGEIKTFVTQQSAVLNIHPPKVYLVEDILPQAYSITNIKPAIFLSVGLCEILRRKELEGVLFHELYHISNKTSFWKFSINIVRIFSPLAAFITNDEVMNQEEQDADAYAIFRQQTKKYLHSAKRKINGMNKKIRHYG